MFDLNHDFCMILARPLRMDEYLSYFIKPQSLDFVKIGRSSKYNLRKRMVTLQRATPLDLSILATSTELENTLHLRFKSYQHRGEWFRLSGKLVTYIEER